ncbi:MAG: YggT family protein [Acidobacteriota bacterium]|jgi:YggT family protein
MGFLINFFDLLFTLLGFAIIARALVSWLPIDRYHPVIRVLDQITEPILAPLRRYIPPVGGMMDITPIVALILIQILQAIVHRVLVNMYYG